MGHFSFEAVLDSIAKCPHKEALVLNTRWPMLPQTDVLKKRTQQKVKEKRASLDFRIITCRIFHRVAEDSLVVSRLYPLCKMGRWGGFFKNTSNKQHSVFRSLVMLQGFLVLTVFLMNTSGILGQNTSTQFLIISISTTCHFYF